AVAKSNGTLRAVAATTNLNEVSEWMQDEDQNLSENNFPGDRPTPESTEEQWCAQKLKTPLTLEDRYYSEYSRYHRAAQLSPLSVTSKELTWWGGSNSEPNLIQKLDQREMGVSNRQYGGTAVEVPLKKRRQREWVGGGQGIKGVLMEGLARWGENVRSYALRDGEHIYNYPSHSGGEESTSYHSLSA
ncbi:hypothetical protein FRC11_000172, partial [Ceratobasidium sp. 423]